MNVKYPTELLARQRVGCEAGFILILAVIGPLTTSTHKDVMGQAHKLVYLG